MIQEGVAATQQASVGGSSTHSTIWPSSSALASSTSPASGSTSTRVGRPDRLQDPILGCVAKAGDPSQKHPLLVVVGHQNAPAVGHPKSPFARREATDGRSGRSTPMGFCRAQPTASSLHPSTKTEGMSDLAARSSRHCVTREMVDEAGNFGDDTGDRARLSCRRKIEAGEESPLAADTFLMHRPAGSVDSTWNSDPAEVTGKARAPDQRSNVLLAPIEHPDGGSASAARRSQPDRLRLRERRGPGCRIYWSRKRLRRRLVFVSEADMIFQLAAEEQKLPRSR